MKENEKFVGHESPIETKTQEEDYCYYSKLLQRQFDSLEDLKKAEAEYRNKNALELKKKEERRQDAKKVEEAYKELIEAKKKAAKIIDEAEKKYLEEKNSFVSKYGAFHLTYSNLDNKESISVSDLIDRFFDVHQMLPFFGGDDNWFNRF